MDTTSLASVVLHVASLVFFIASAPTAFVLANTSSFVVTVGLFQTCYSIGTLSACAATTSSCESFQHVITLCRACVVASCCVVAANVVATVFRLVMPSASLSKWMYVAFSVIAAITGLLQWAPSFALFAGEFCGNSLSSSEVYVIGPSPFLACLGWCATLAAVAVEMAIPVSTPDVPPA